MSESSREIDFPVMRYDIMMPLLEGRVPIKGVTLKPVKSSSMINKEDPKLKAGDFGLMDLNIGYLLPAIEATKLDRYDFTTSLLSYISSKLFDQSTDVTEEELYERFEDEYIEIRSLHGGQSAA